DRPEIFLTFLINGKNPKSTVAPATRDFDFKVDVHNPLDKPVEVTLRRTKGFDMITEFEKKAAIPAGTSITVELK
ncbi:MAG: hypothetical protein KKD33_04155, partial [Verrucomicrobia bacterium]|nr:hypothetical protein [Verrucomicrobiota bacterium]